MGTARRIGLLGGTFDPPHIGHLWVAVEARSSLDLDAVVLMVAASPWQKVGVRTISSAEDRLAVTRAAAEGLTGIEVSALEIGRGGSTFTADTLSEMRGADPEAELFLIIGRDVAADLQSWVRVEEVRALATLVPVNRPGPGPPVSAEHLRAQGWRVEPLEVPALDVSSSDIRARLADGRPIEVLVPPGAIREIENRGLYSPP
jgi:nicotinate-nucleotide adenylyltransferase